MGSTVDRAAFTSSPADDMRASTDTGPEGVSPPLDYQPGHPVRSRRRRNRVVGAVVIATFVALCAWQGAGAYRWAVRAYWARQVANYRAPADMVVYEEDPAQWPALLARGGYRGTPSNLPGWCPFVAHVNEPVRRFVETHELMAGGDAVVFAHARQTPSGKERVVIVWLPYNAVRCNEKGATPDNQVQMTFFTGVWDGTKLREGRVALWVAPDRIARDRTTPLYARLCAGQPAISDPTQFTIALEMSEYFDVIDGYLRDDDTVLLRPRSHEHLLNPK
jgi:hypothetical protein